MTFYVPYHSQGWHGRIANGWQALLEDVDGWLALNPGESVVNFPSRQVRRVEPPAGRVYVKILRSGGDAHGPRRWPLAGPGDPACLAETAGRGLRLSAANPCRPPSFAMGLADRTVHQL